MGAGQGKSERFAVLTCLIYCVALPTRVVAHFSLRTGSLLTGTVALTHHNNQNL